jgi:outer membrane protein assembly factor BamD
MRTRAGMPGHGWRQAARLLALALVVVALPACSFFGKEDVIPDDPADKLYNEGLYLLNQKKDYKQAAKRFEEVDRQHPYSEWARKALIMSAYAHYEGTKYDDSVSAAKRYVTLHPGSPDAAYAQYLIGSSYFDQIPDITRDQQRTERAMQALDEVVRKYPAPNTPSRQAQARGRARPARRQGNGTARYYQKRRDYIAAINRFKVVITQYQTTRHVERR